MNKYEIKISSDPKRAKFKFSKPVRLPFVLYVDGEVLSHHRTQEGASKSIAMHKRNAALRILEDKQIAEMECSL